MENLPKLNRQILIVSDLNDTQEEKKYWLSKDPNERFEAIEINRRMVYGRDRVTSRLQRILETAELNQPLPRSK
jgi:hypothetical protein